MKLTILTVGKKNTVFAGAEEEYLKRISRFADLEVEMISHSDIKTEEEKFLGKIKHTDYVILLDEKGSITTSIDFANLIDTKMNESVKRIIFVIGGAYGVGEELKKRANYILSFGKMVWPHALCRTMLLEQIYRSYTILGGIPYHNE